MFKKTFQYFSFFLLLIDLIYSLKCGVNYIDSCKECDSGINSDLCKTCIDKYFLQSNGRRCVKCDDIYLGMEGCGGNCQLIKSENKIICEDNKCKDGYYENYPGNCDLCSNYYKDCTKCSYLPINNNDINLKEFKCLECKYNYYPSIKYDKCIRCDIANCIKCLNYTFCQECDESYILYPDGLCYNNKIFFNEYDCIKAIYSEEKQRIICIECESNWALNPDGTCSDYIYGCIKPIYSEEKGRAICSECSSNYILYPNGTCVFNRESDCIIYSEENNVIICLECNRNYILYPNGTCIYHKNSNCKKLIYSGENDKLICSECHKSYFLLPNGTCMYNYHYSCSKVYYSEEKDQIVCLDCDLKYFINYYNECSSCLYYQNEFNDYVYSNCEYCHSENDKIICDKIKDNYNNYYYLDSYANIKNCSYTIPGCKRCSFHSEDDFENNILKCDTCEDNKVLTSDGLKCEEIALMPNGSYVYYKKIFGKGCDRALLSYLDYTIYCAECLEGYIKGYDGICKDCESDGKLYGCKKCNIRNNQYYCIICKENYIKFGERCILIYDDDFSNCTEVENIEKNNEIIYSCLKCKFYSNILAIKSNGAKICIDIYNIKGMYNCKLSKKEDIGINNYTCIKCYDEYKLEYDELYKKEICKACVVNCITCGYDNCLTCNDRYYCESCIEGYYLDNNKICKNCPYFCNSCFLNENSEIICETIKEPYFLNNTIIESCSYYLNACVKCSITDNNYLKCEKCVDDLFVNQNNICEHCYRNKNISLTCISCTDNDNIKLNSPCQKCNRIDYYLTKNNTCIFCKSMKYGGEKCSKCGYININGEEKIGCIKCSSKYKLTVDGKCVDINIENCINYSTYINDNNIIKVGCEECDPNYYVTENKTCENKDLFPEISEDIIDGCLNYGYNNSIYYCLLCEKDYTLINGYCYKPSNFILNNPFLQLCNLTFTNGLWECNKCYYSYNSYLRRYSYDTFEIDFNQYCNNQLYGRCSLFENLGTQLMPIYSCAECEIGRFIIYENGVKECIWLSRILEAKVNTSYYEDIYTAIKCEQGYVVRYSDYYETMDCMKEGDEENYYVSYEYDQGLPIKNGKCDDYYFTRNNKVCIKCDDSINGMPGCNGKCNFNGNKSIILRCEENKCKENYFEKLPGVCELCNKVISGCQSCDYILNDIKLILKPERKRKLICIKCNEGLYISNNGTCKLCNIIIPGCKKCETKNNKTECIEVDDGYFFDKKGNIKKCKKNCKECSIFNKNGVNKLLCTKPNLGYYLDKNQKLIQCEENCSECLMVNDNGIITLRCIDENVYYFYNKEGKKIECSDKNEGITGCKRCEYKTELICNFCQNNYKLFNNKCLSFEEYKYIQGCLEYKYRNGTYHCTICKDSYFYNNYLQICEEKTGELEFCSGIQTIKLGNKFIYNCTYCKGNRKTVRNLDGYFTCYDYDLLNDMKYCKLIVNIGTYDEPFFICELCWSYNYYDYIISIDDYGNQICEQSYNYMKGCIKRHKIYNEYDDYSRYNYIYQCLECDINYIFINFTCVPLDCQVPHCTECSKENVYICNKCDEGYNFTKLNKCYIIPDISPVITFKDIFKFEFNEILKKTSLFRFSFYLRGITIHTIKLKHSFILSTIFSLKGKLRHLENLEKADIYKTFCEFEKEMNNDNKDIKFVDYKCYFDADKDLRDYYNMESLNEDMYKDTKNLKALNLEYLLNNIDIIEKTESSLDQNELNKYVLFTVDYKSKLIQLENKNNFNFEIKGKTNKKLNYNLNGILTFLNTDNKKAMCELNANDDNNALLSCNANISEIIINNINIKLNFKEQEIIGENDNIYFEGLNEVILNYEIENKNEKNNNNKVGLIVGLVIGSVILLGSIIIIISVYIYKRHDKKNIEEIKDKVQSGNVNINVYNKNKFEINIDKYDKESKDTINNDIPK